MKKLSALLIVFLFLGHYSFSRDGKLKVGLNIFPNISVPFPVTNSNVPVNNPSVGYNLDDPLYNWTKFSFSATIFGQYAVSEKFKINAGIGYLNNGSTSIGKSQQQGAWVYNGETPTINQNHLEIPLTFDLYFGRRFYWNAGISATYNFLTTSKISTGTSTIKSDFYRKLNLFANMGLGIDYIKNDNLSAYIQPYVQYGFLGVGKNVPTNLIMFAFGLSTGIRI